jgi:hypothetical protein
MGTLYMSAMISFTGARRGIAMTTGKRLDATALCAGLAGMYGGDVKDKAWGNCRGLREERR